MLAEKSRMRGKKGGGAKTAGGYGYRKRRKRNETRRSQNLSDVGRYSVRPPAMARHAVWPSVDD